ncbi:PEP-CTERM sorting domain-containing protein [Aquabacterium sp. A3]|uniref:PEP-CTERM sorting domain-containing protein n=1 Tax=Aquabacterium sp. A3 TaxID=3132829 RepID=UPI00311A701F
MKLQYIAAAVALATGMGAANAALERGSNGNGSLIMIAYDNRGGTTTAGVFDLGLSINDLIGATGNGTAIDAASLSETVGTMKWDFINNTITLDGTVTSFGGTNDWTGAWNTLLANSDAADLRFVVTGFDTTGFGTNKRSIVTGVQDPLPSQLFNSTTNASNIQQIAAQNDIFTPQNSRGTHTTVANGAYTFTAADGATTRANGYAMAGDAFGNNWRNFNNLGGETFANMATYLWAVDGTAAERILAYEVTLDVANGVLSAAVPTPAVPEPSTYALVIAGLAVAGIAARRRKA